MATKRVVPRAVSTPSTSGPLVTTLLLGVALSYGVWTLVARGKLDWPPTQLLASIYTVAGCLALVGPIILSRKGPGDLGLGELIWMAGGLMIWIFDAASVARGEARSLTWATPLSYQPMGLTILAISLAGWRCRVGGANWSWSNVTGWTLGIFWVAMAAITLLPTKALGIALR